MNYSILNEIAVLLIMASSSFARRPSRARPRGVSLLRVYNGYNDTEGKYPYVVALVTKTYRLCTGSLIAPKWVLTAAHCYNLGLVAIQFGDMTVLPAQSTTKRKLITFIKPENYIISPLNNYHLFKNDIALMRVDEVRMDVYGRIAAMDYRTLVGLAVEYAGYGDTSPNALTHEEYILDDKRPLQLGTGVVSPCMKKGNYGQYICLSQRCGNGQMGLGGDSGGPLVYDGKIVGVYSFIDAGVFYAYTPVSPYLEWIQNTMAAYIDEI